MPGTAKTALLTATAALTSALGLVALGSGSAWAHGTAAGGPHTARATAQHVQHTRHPGHQGRHSPAHHRPGPPTGPGDPADPGDPVTCMALYDLTEETDTGFTATVEVMNHGTEPMTGWTVTWTPGVDTEITAVEDGVLTHHDDGTVSVRNTDSNATVPPDGAEVTFSFTATSTGNDFPIGSIRCTSP